VKSARRLRRSSAPAAWSGSGTSRTRPLFVEFASTSVDKVRATMILRATK